MSSSTVEQAVIIKNADGSTGQLQVTSNGLKVDAVLETESVSIGNIHIQDPNTPANMLAVDSSGKIGVNALPAVTLGTDSVGLAKESGGNLAAAKTDLDAIKTSVANIPASPALETGNLATIASQTANVAKETGGNLATIVSQTANVAKETGGNLATLVSQTAQRTYQVVTGSVSASGDNSIVAAVTGKVIKVYDFSLQAANANTAVVTAAFYSDVGGSETQVGQNWDLNVREGVGRHGTSVESMYDCKTAQGKALNLHLSAAQTVYYTVIYTSTDAS